MHPKVQPDYSVGTERYKLIYFNKIDLWELFDLGKNRHELKNVNAETPASAGVSFPRGMLVPPSPVYE